MHFTSLDAPLFFCPSCASSLKGLQAIQAVPLCLLVLRQSAMPLESLAADLCRLVLA